MSHKKHDFHHHHQNYHNQKTLDLDNESATHESILDQLSNKKSSDAPFVGHKDLAASEEYNVMETPKTQEQELRDEIVHLQEELDNSKNQLLRALAEAENTRRLSKLDVEKAHKFGVESFAKALLPIIDSLEKTLENCTNAQENTFTVLKDGTELTHKMFLKTLEQFGIQCIDPLHQPFNPAQHEAISTQPHADKSENTVVAVLQKGYELNKRLIRPALVIVSKKTI